VGISVVSYQFNGCNNTSGNNNKTILVAPQNTTGANFLALVICGHNNAVTITDTYSNVYTLAGSHYNSVGDSCYIMYNSNPTVGINHNVSISAGSNLIEGCAGLLACSGVASSPMDQYNGNNGGTDVAFTNTGNITPSQNGSLIISAAGFYSQGYNNSSAVFTTNEKNVAYVSNQMLAAAMSYYIQPTATALNCNWGANSAVVDFTSVIVDFKPYVLMSSTDTNFYGQS